MFQPRDPVIRLPRWGSARWAWPCLLMADVRPSMNPPMASPVRTALDPSCWSWPVRLKRPRGAPAGVGDGAIFRAWDGRSRTAFSMGFPWVFPWQSPSILGSLVNFPTDFRSIASRQNGKQELAMALGVCVNQVRNPCRNGDYPLVISGNLLHSYGKIRHVSWENPRFRLGHFQ